MLREWVGEGQNKTILAPLRLNRSKDTWLKYDVSPTTVSFHSNSFAFVFSNYKETMSPKNTQFGPIWVIGQIWRLGSEK
jgi:hypothetical protein